MRANTLIGSLGVTWVATSEEEPARIDGYYTLAMNALLADELQSSRIRLPRIPVLLLGRLAVDVRMQGQGFGTQLLMHALYTAYYLSQIVGNHAVVVDPISDRAREWYSRHGFLALPGAPARMLLPIATLHPQVPPLTGQAEMAELLTLSSNLTPNTSEQEPERT